MIDATKTRPTFYEQKDGTYTPIPDPGLTNTQIWNWIEYTGFYVLISGTLYTSGSNVTWVRA